MLLMLLISTADSAVVSGGVQAWHLMMAKAVIEFEPKRTLTVMTYASCT